MNLSNNNVIHIKKDGIQYLQFRKLLDFGLINCYTLSNNDIDFNRNGENVNKQILQNSYKKICEALNMPINTIVRPYQSHTDRVEFIEKLGNDDDYKDVDGLITNKPNINLMLTYADCTPILLYDFVNKVIGNIHSGWRGTSQKIGKKAVLKMMDIYKSKPENIIACIGPCIGKCHFEVKKDVKTIFENNFSYLNRNSDIILKNDNKYFVDTTLINRLILEEVGIKNENIFESGICTACNSNIIHSHRINGKKAGRNVAVIGLK